MRRTKRFAGFALAACIGLFEDGYAFDALVLDDSALKNMRTFTPAERLERYAYLGRGALTAKFAQGKKLL